MPIYAGHISGSTLTGSLTYTNLTNVPSGIISHSAQVIAAMPSGIVSSSTQINNLSGVTASFATTASFAMNAAGGGGGGPAVSYITQSNPVGTVNPATSGVLWLNVSSSELFTCADNFNNLNEWAGTAGTRLYYARPQSSSLAQPVLAGIISGSSTNVVLTLIDRYGGQLTNLITPTQSIQFTSGSSIITLTSSSGVYSGSGKYHAYISTTNLSGSTTVSASIGGTVLSTNLTVPIFPPRNIRGFGSNALTLFSTSSTAPATVTSGSGGVQFIDNRTNYWVSASCGYGFCLFLDITGRLYSRGNNTNGQCSQGNNSTVTALTEVTASGGPWKTMSAGYLHACAINVNNELYCWGDNTYGSLGLGDATQRTSATKVNSDTNWATVSCGTYSTLATKTTGTLWACGLNNNGQLGTGDAVNRSTPTQIGSSTDWAKVFAGYLASHAIKTTGTLWGVGLNSSNQLGDGTLTNKTTFVQIGAATDWVTVTSVKDNSSDVFKLGIRGTTLYGWGNNATGILTSQSIGATFTTPTQLTASVPPVKDVTCNQHQVFILDTGSGLWGWASTNMTATSASAGTYLAYGTSINAKFDNTASLGNQPQAGSVQRVSSIYTHQQISAINYGVGGLITITNIQTSSAGPSGAPGIPTASVINNFTACRVQWNNTDITAETRVDIASASLTQSNWIRPGAVQVYVQPTTATGSSTIVRLAHIKNELTSSFVTSSALSFCPAAYSYEISNTCDANGRRTIVYPDGNCGTITSGPSCDLGCGGYTYQGVQGYSNGYNPYTGQSNVYYELATYTKGSCTVQYYTPCYCYWYWWDCCYYYAYSGYDCNTGCY